MEKDERQSGGPEQVAGSREPQRVSRPAPGKVTRTSRLSPSRGPAVQRKAAVPTSGAVGPQARSLWDLTMDPWMDMAHRGVIALTDRRHDMVQVAGPIQAKGLPESPEAPVSLSGRGGGAALPEEVRGKMETALGADFSSVRIHEGPHAGAIGALACTQGVDIHFAPGQYQPTSQRGQELLGHELTHVVQQSTGQVPTTAQVGGANINDDASLEGEADEMGARAARGEGSREQSSAPTRVGPAQLTHPSPDALLDPSPLSGGGGTVVQRQQPADRDRRSRITVASSVQANRPTYPDDQTGGRLTTALLQQLRDRRRSVADATERAGEGDHRFGGRSRAGAEERSGFSLGHTAAATGAATRRAVVITNSDYDNTRTMGATVEPARDLTGPHGPGYDGPRVTGALTPRGYATTELQNQSATQIQTALQTAISGLGAGSELVFYYNGHGTIEGLIGVDGSVFTPAHAGAIRDTARAAQVDFTMVLEGCHTGIFVDYLRGREFADTRSALQQRQAAAVAGTPQAQRFTDLVALLDEAIAAQTERDAYNRAMQGWWAQRFVVEQPINAGDTGPEVLEAWDAHMLIQRDHFNALVPAANPHLANIQTRRAALGLRGGHALQLTLVPRRGDQLVDDQTQRQLDDMDIVLNGVLEAVDGELARP